MFAICATAYIVAWCDEITGTEISGHHDYLTENSIQDLNQGVARNACYQAQTEGLSKTFCASRKMTPTTFPYERVADVRCGVGESPFWHVAEQAWYWIGIPDKKIWRYKDSSQPELAHWNTDEMILPRPRQ